jgi:hypothetical protein
MANEFRNLVLDTIYNGGFVDYGRGTSYVSNCGRMYVDIFDELMDYPFDESLEGKLFEYNNEVAFILFSNIDFEINEPYARIRIDQDFIITKSIKCNYITFDKSKNTSENICLVTADMFNLGMTLKEFCKDNTKTFTNIRVLELQPCDTLNDVKSCFDIMPNLLAVYHPFDIGICDKLLFAVEKFRPYKKPNLVINDKHPNFITFIKLLAKNSFKSINCN